MAWHAKCARGSHTPQLFFFMHLSHVHLMTGAASKLFKLKNGIFAFRLEEKLYWRMGAKGHLECNLFLFNSESTKFNTKQTQLASATKSFFFLPLRIDQSNELCHKTNIILLNCRIFFRFRFHFCKLLSSFSEGLFASLCRAFLLVTTILWCSCSNARLSS